MNNVKNIFEKFNDKNKKPVLGFFKFQKVKITIGAGNPPIAQEPGERLGSKPVEKKSFFDTLRKKPAKSSIYVDEFDTEKEDRSPRQWFLRMSLQDQIIFAKRLGILIKAGVPILTSLKMLREQSGSRNNSRIVSDLYRQVESGKSLAVAMKRYRGIFGDFAVNIVHVGEMSGTLTQNLNYLADELKKKQELRRSIVSALVYPAFIIVATLAIVILLTAYVFPKIVPVFASFNTELPWSTRALIVISGIMENYWIHIVAGVILFSIIWTLLLKIPTVRLMNDRNLLRLPLLGPMFRSYYAANFTRTLGLLLKSEVGILEALRIVGESSGNAAYKKSFKEISEGVLRGESISDAMSKEKLLYPSLVFQMVGVGEMTGGLSTSLMYLSEMFEDEMNSSTKNLTTSIEPVLMIIMGVLVGFIALSVITPIYGITQSLHA